MAAAVFGLLDDHFFSAPPPPPLPTATTTAAFGPMLALALDPPLGARGRRARRGRPVVRLANRGARRRSGSRRHGRGAAPAAGALCAAGGLAAAGHRCVAALLPSVALYGCLGKPDEHAEPPSQCTRAHHQQRAHARCACARAAKVIGAGPLTRASHCVLCEALHGEASFPCARAHTYAHDARAGMCRKERRHVQPDRGLDDAVVPRHVMGCCACARPAAQCTDCLCLGLTHGPRGTPTPHRLALCCAPPRVWSPLAPLGGRQAAATAA